MFVVPVLLHFYTSGLVLELANYLGILRSLLASPLTPPRLAPSPAWLMTEKTQSRAAGPSGGQTKKSCAPALPTPARPAWPAMPCPPRPPLLATTRSIISPNHATRPHRRDDVAAAVADCSCDIILHLAQSTEARWQTSNLNHR